MPRRKVMGKIKRETNPGVMATGDEELLPEVLPVEAEPVSEPKSE